MKKVLFILTFVIVATSCHFNKKYQNREEDLLEAQMVVADLFYTIRHSEFDNATEFFSEEFYEVTSKEELMEIFKSTENKLGYLDKGQLLFSNTMVSEGAINQGIYNMEYDVKFEKGSAKVKLVLTKKDDSKIKVVAYNIQFNNFLDKKTGN
ncbi:hypothetical protein ACKGJY_03145 [Hyunsoonleella sp. 2307UL5-6]|uniref:hypothetical protein n=1 Tax=Hyunsoonleella sp. 2307UL5-6 TaxID=3384768 RepID=UPI0039BCEB10